MSERNKAILFTFAFIGVMSVIVFGGAYVADRATAGDRKTYEACVRRCHPNTVIHSEPRCICDLTQEIKDTEGWVPGD